MSEKRWYQRSDMIVALSAVFVSLVAVGVGVYSAYIERSFARASTWPRIEIFRSLDRQSPAYRLIVTNQGTGPAIIRYAKLSQKGQSYSGWGPWIASNYPVEEGSFTQSHIGSRVISSGQSVTVFETQSSSLTNALANNDTGDLALCYCSVFDDCWMTNRSNNTVETPSCEQIPDVVFEQ